MDVNQIVEKYPHTLQAIRTYLGLPEYQGALVILFAKKGSQIERRRLRNAIQSKRTNSNGRIAIHTVNQSLSGHKRHTPKRTPLKSKHLDLNENQTTLKR